MNELAKRIAKAIKQHEGWHEDDDESDVAELITKELAPLVEALNDDALVDRMSESRFPSAANSKRMAINATARLEAALTASE